MLEEVFRALNDVGDRAVTEEMIKDMHKSIHKRRQDGGKKIYLEQAHVDMLDNCLKSIVELKKVLRRIDKKTRKLEV